MEQYIEFIGNHPFLIAALGLTMAMLMFHEFQRASAAGSAISVNQATRMQNDSDALFLDVRDGAAFKAGHLIDARNIPLKTLTGKVSELAKYKDKPIIAYCESGIQSGKACNLLRKEGFTELYSLQGGLTAWEKASLPVVTK